MNKVVLCRGLPGSGKSYWAKQYCKENPSWKRVNKDDLRNMVDDGVWSKENEKFIIKARDTLVMEALNAGFNVIVDDTNFSDKHFNHIVALVKDIANVSLNDFSDVPLELCIARDEKRKGRHKVGKDVIMRFYNQFLNPMVKNDIKVDKELGAKLKAFQRQQKDALTVEVGEKPPYNPEFKTAALCDIDGTLAFCGDRNIYDLGKVYLDTVSEPVRHVIKRLHDSGMTIVIMSGRDEVARSATEKWLKDNDVPYHEFHMRAQGDRRSDDIVKRELYESHIKGKYNVFGVFDDRKRVKRMWVSEGLFVFDVNQTDKEF